MMTLKEDMIVQEYDSRIRALLQHPMFSTNQHMLCSIPIISKAWRAGARRANTSYLEASVSTAKGMSGIHSFSRWLPRYYSVPCGIRIRGGETSGVNIESADSVLSLSLQLAAAKACMDGSSMQLHTYCSDVFIGRYVLLSLPQNTLTSLEFSNIRKSNMADISIGLQHLRNLRSLQLMGLEGCVEALAVDVCMPAIGQLTSLTNLVLLHVASFSYQQPRTASLQRLVVAYSDYPPQPVVAAFSHLTCLSYLSLFLPEDCAANAELGPLPAQLVGLDLCLPRPYSRGLSTATSLNISAVTGLRKVALCFSCETADCLLALRTLNNLQSVEIHSNLLSLNDTNLLSEASAAWSHLPLHSVHFKNGGVPVASLGQLLQNTSGTTSLTRLVLEDIMIFGPGLMPPFCGGLANLSGLRDLSLQFTAVGEVDFVAHDVQKLSALTQLTELHLKPIDVFVMDDDVVLLALHLQRLQILYVPVRSVTVLAAICRGGSKDLQVVGTYISCTLEQNVAWQRYVDESKFLVKVVES